MDINKELFFKIIQNNFEHEVVDTPLGRAVKMCPRDAFIYSCVTGSGYLDNPIYPYTPKGLLKLFYNAFDYKFVTGIFDNYQIKNTPYVISLAKPYIFKGDKFILPIEFQKESELNSILRDLSSKVTDPENYIVQRIESSKKGNGMEPFLEYLTTEYFKKHGHIVENQVPLAHSIGSPDFAGYGLSEFISVLNNEGLFSGNGFHIIELSMLRIFPNTPKNEPSSNNELIVGEAKTSTTVITKQLEKYLNTGLFDYGYEIHPNKPAAGRDDIGLIVLDDNLKIKVVNPVKKFLAGEPLSKESYLKWLEIYMKFYLLANFSNDEINTFYYEVFGRQVEKQSDLVEFVQKVSTKDLIDKIKLL
jgi:hypothetical protein